MIGCSNIFILLVSRFFFGNLFKKSKKNYLAVGCCVALSSSQTSVISFFTDYLIVLVLCRVILDVTILSLMLLFQLIKKNAKRALTWSFLFCSFFFLFRPTYTFWVVTVFLSLSRHLAEDYRHLIDKKKYCINKKKHVYFRWNITVL